MIELCAGPMMAWTAEGGNAPFVMLAASEWVALAQHRLEPLGKEVLGGVADRKFSGSKFEEMRIKRGTQLNVEKLHHNRL